MRNKHIGIRVSEIEYHDIQGSAKILHLPIGSFMRMVALQYKPERSADNGRETKNSRH